MQELDHDAKSQAVATSDPTGATPTVSTKEEVEVTGRHLNLRAVREVARSCNP